MSARDAADLEGRVTTLRKAIKKLEDPTLVHAVLQAKSAARMKGDPEPRFMRSE